MNTSAFLLLLALTMPAVRYTAAAESPPPAAPPPMHGGAAGLPAGHPAMPAQPKAEMATGEVLETADAGTYTLVRVKVGQEELWAAGPKVPVKVGDTVSFDKGMEMRQFHSDTLNRTFASIYFAGALVVNGAKAATAPPAAASSPAASTGNMHGSVGAVAPSGVDVSGVKPAAGGKTVKDVLEHAAALAGQEITLRGKVVKSNLGVMKRNWLHLRDGTQTADGKNDLTVTSNGVANVGDTVLVKGKVATNEDFGFGYRYDVMIEDAALTKE